MYKMKIVLYSNINLQLPKNINFSKMQFILCGSWNWSERYIAEYTFRKFSLSEQSDIQLFIALDIPEGEYEYKWFVNFGESDVWMNDSTNRPIIGKYINQELDTKQFTYEIKPKIFVDMLFNGASPEIKTIYNEPILDIDFGDYSISLTIA